MHRGGIACGLVPAPDPIEIARRTARARTRARQRPPARDIQAPAAWQESVWDYPRPPRIEPVSETVEVAYEACTIARTTEALRVIETAGAPVIYIPAHDVREGRLQITGDWGLCEWKGVYYNFDLTLGDRVVSQAGWMFPEPFTDLGQGYERLRRHFAFHPAKVTCMLGEDCVRAQPGGHYGGWVTERVTGPFKGSPGSDDW